MSTLPTPRPATLAELRRFDTRHGLPAALGVLRRSLRPLELARVLGAMALGGARDPLRHLPASPRWTPDTEALVRHQLRAAVRLDDATARALRGPAWPEARRQRLLLDVISATGSRFIEHNVPFPTREDWRGSTAQARQAFIEALRGRLFNAQLEPAGIEADAVGFDVSACRFVELCAALERPYLASMFCEADSRFFAEHTDLIELRRSRTQARDGAPCDFRFTLRG
ncbi:MAG: L-2-amino-thiazoline-4-carboxylic acid hydrolase [Myxococcales bacterium]|nr:L-2-amino-thiazoline-4-carboxylic acid hydrolase [Myxococcales bacterium]MCB9628549.1 L-2-amino-thiazoline-4-carboxylic acid hydrolase [Sandaracinaceae bacterium]